MGGKLCFPPFTDWSKTATNNTKKVSSENLGKSLSSSSFGSSTANWTSKAKATLNPFNKRHSNSGETHIKHTQTLAEVQRNLGQSGDVKSRGLQGPKGNTQTHGFNHISELIHPVYSTTERLTLEIPVMSKYCVYMQTWPWNWIKHRLSLNLKHTRSMICW